MQAAVRQFFLTRPLWQSVPVIVAISVATSLGVMLTLNELFGAPSEEYVTRSIIIATIVPMIVSAPIGGFIVHLMREVDRARHEALRQAWRDELTGLMNRRRFAEVGARELTLAQRSQRRLVAMLLDVDDFKRINDRHGHAAGDGVLQAVGQLLPGQLRATDVVARWGGEEFALLLPDVGLGDAAHLAERVRSAVEALQVDAAAGLPLQCTVSIGMTEAAPHDTFDSLVNRADEAMYLAKAAGKNRIIRAA